MPADIMDIGFRTGTVAISLVALFRPELTQLSKRFLGHLDYYPSGSLEIGFGIFGPTVCIRGSLASPVFDRFITRVDFNLRRPADKPKLPFDWMLFRSTSIHATGGNIKEEDQLQLCSPFVLKGGGVERKDILFACPTLRPIASKCLQLLDIKWKNHLSEHGLDKTPAEIRKLGGQFLRDDKDVNETTTMFFATCIWEPGTYEGDLTFSSGYPNRRFEYKFSFDLNPGDVATIQVNREKILSAVLFPEPVVYGMAYPEGKFTPKHG